jgi:CheY-like chemotaxis protein
MNTGERPLRVLLVEDDVADVALVADAFTDQEIASDLHHVGDGAEALAFLRREPPYTDAPRPDLILLDLNMPRVDGRQALSEIKADDGLKAIPVVVFTTSAAVDDVVNSYAAHANAYVTKPIDLDEFERALAGIRGFWGRTVTLPHVDIDDP